MFKKSLSPGVSVEHEKMGGKLIFRNWMEISKHMNRVLRDGTIDRGCGSGQRITSKRSPCTPNLCTYFAVYFFIGEIIITSGSVSLENLIISGGFPFSRNSGAPGVVQWRRGVPGRGTRCRTAAAAARGPHAAPGPLRYRRWAAAPSLCHTTGHGKRL